MTASTPPAVAASASGGDTATLAALLAGAGRLVVRHASDYYGLAGWLLVPLLLVVAAFATGGATGNLLITIANVGFIFLLAWFLSAGTLLTAVAVHHPDRVIDPRHLGAAAWKRVSPLLATLLLAAVLELAGLLLFIVPGIIAFTYFTFALEVSVLGNRSGFTGLAASRELVRGKFWTIFWRAFGIFAAVVLVYLLLVTLLVMLGASLGSLDPAMLTQAPPPLWLEVAISVLQIALLPFALAAHVLLYLSLCDR